MRRLSCILISILTVLIPSAVYANQPSSDKEAACLSTCVSLNQPAKRVVALNWSAAEMLLSLGIKPVGITEGRGYRKWQTNNPQLPEDVAEVGRRQEPNLAVIANLKPDLIVGYDFRHQRLYPVLNQIAPTLLYQQFPRLDQPEFRYFEQAQQIFTTLAVVTGTERQAALMLDDMDKTLVKLRKAIKESGLAGTSVTYGKFVGMGYGLRIFSNHSLAGSVAEQLGLNYQWQSTLPGKDFVHLQLEQLPGVINTHLLLAGNQTDSERMTRSPVWPYLPFVKQNALSEVEPLWSFGGPKSIERMARVFTKSLLDWKEKSNG
ncbi:ABC-type Fe3+-hydroxamate transport system, periplasmic component [Vibrio coralliirubri]|nr:ABC-type Fe3+-hydroxamate transport system, periplasmic component [Vibrio coralliirubri]